MNTGDSIGELSVAIKELRLACGMTQAAFADYLESSKRTIEDWESGRRTPPEWVVKLIEYKLKNEGLYKVYNKC